MPPATRPIPEGHHTVTPYLSCRGAADAIAFYERALDAKLLFSMNQPDGRVGHAELQIGGSRVMLADEFPEIGFQGPLTLGGAGVHLHLYVDDADAAFERAIAAGAEVLRPMTDQFYGDRSGTVQDPFGHVWHIATHVEDVSPEQLAERAKSH